MSTILWILCIGGGIWLCSKYRRPTYWYEDESPLENAKVYGGITLIAIGVVILLYSVFFGAPSDAKQNAENQLVQQLGITPSDEITLVGEMCITASRYSCQTWEAEVLVNGTSVGLVTYDSNSARMKR